MKVQDYKFGSIIIDGQKINSDTIVNKGKIEKRNKKGTENYSGHAPLLISENIPWDCELLIIGNGMSGVMEVDKEIIKEAKNRGVDLVILPTFQAIKKFNLADQTKTNAVFHLTC